MIKALTHTWQVSKNTNDVNDWKATNGMDWLFLNASEFEYNV